MCWALGPQTDHSRKVNSGRKGHGETWRRKAGRLGHGRGWGVRRSERPPCKGAPEWRDGSEGGAPPQGGAGASLACLENSKETSVPEASECPGRTACG